MQYAAGRAEPAATARAAKRRAPLDIGHPVTPIRFRLRRHGDGRAVGKGAGERRERTVAAHVRRHARFAVPVPPEHGLGHRVHEHRQGNLSRSHERGLQRRRAVGAQIAHPALAEVRTRRPRRAANFRVCPALHRLGGRRGGTRVQLQRRPGGAGPGVPPQEGHANGSLAREVTAPQCLSASPASEPRPASGPASRRSGSSSARYPRFGLARCPGSSSSRRPRGPPSPRSSGASSS